MKKMFLMLVILAIATPAGAEVFITAADSGGELVTISYDASGEASLVRAFALNITVDGNATITAVDDSAVDPNYWVHPGSMTFWDGDVNSEGTAVCNASKYPGTQPGIGFNGVTLEMGTLYVGAPNGPDDSGVLCTVQCDGNGDASYNLSITANTIRTAVVLEDGTVADANCTGCVVNTEEPPCFPECHPDYDEWLAVGEPNSWCNPRQCHGDADAFEEGDEKQGYYWVGGFDLGVLIGGWKKPATDPGFSTFIAADFDHFEEGDEKQGYYRVGGFDLGILIGSWKQDGVVADCLDCP